MMKGNRRCKWIKDGVRESRKIYKKAWNRKVRKLNCNFKSGCEYKKIAGYAIYEMCL